MANPSGPQSSSHANLKHETIKIPLPQVSGGGKLPPVPPKVALAASAEEPDKNPIRVNPPTIKLPLLPPHQIKAPAPVPRPAVSVSTKLSPVVEQKVEVAAKTKSEPDVNLQRSQKINGWLGVTAVGVATWALSGLFYAADIANGGSSAWAGHTVVALGALGVTALSAKLLGFFPGSTSLSTPGAETQRR